MPIVTYTPNPSVWIGSQQVYSKAEAQQYCNTNGGVLAKISDVGCSSIIDSNVSMDYCYQNSSLNPNDWTIFDGYEASWANDIVYVQTGIDITSQYGAYPVCIPK